MYWSVLACVVGVEYLAEWLVSWCALRYSLTIDAISLILSFSPLKRIPFYYLFKTLFLLYLALPQTQGASYLYQTQLEPVLREHEPQIDAALAQLRARVFAFLQARARMLWDNVVASATGPQSAPAPESGSSVQTPALSASVSGPTQILGTLWRTYGPAIVAGGTALLQRQGVTPRDARVSSTGEERPQGYDVGDDPEPVLMPRMQSRTPSSESAGGLRARVASSATIGPGGRFEEVEVPSDGEGGRANDSPTSRPSSGWFSWMSAVPTHARSD